MATSLQSLLINRAKAILGSAAVGEDSHREVAVMSEYVEIDYHGRFLIELLQNANDQATKAKKWDAIVTVIRGNDFLAVANQGEPLSPEGLRSLTSLGLSPKDPNELIGNKGIGFKAVYEVSRSPEIYSSPNPTQNFDAENTYAFQISVDVFSGEEGNKRLEDLVNRALAERPEDARSLGGSVNLKLAEEIRAAAPIKFPIELSQAVAQARFGSISGLPTDSQTLVVLPLLQTKEIEDTVNDAIDELLADQGVTILFLPGIAELRLIDRVRNISGTIFKKRKLLRDGLEGDGKHLGISMSVKLGEDPTVMALWHTIESVYGGPKRPKQAAALNAAARKLPGTRFDSVKQIPVAVALRQPTFEGESLEHETKGRICIGLPSKDLTGTRAWIHSHFFGSISRKDVDLQSCEFNKLLFEEAVRLHGLLIKELRSSKSIDDRRLATLAFDCADGPLSKVLMAEGGQAEGEIILLEDGITFARPDQVLVAHPDNLEIVSQIVNASAGEEDHIRVPDSLLALKANSMLQELIDSVGHALDEGEILLTRGLDGMSLLERAAAARRSDGPEFWEPFLTYCLELDPSLKELRNQKLIPVTNHRIARPADGVFLPPTAGAAEADDEEEVDQEEVHRDLIESLPRGVADRLNLVDMQSLRVRLPQSRRLTEFGARLVPTSGGLIRPTRLDELVNSAIIPAIEDLKSSERDLADGLQLLKLAGDLMFRMKDDSRGRVSISKFRVPGVSSTEPGWKWVPAVECSFGTGWLGGRQETLLHEVYAGRDGALLIPWDKFIAFVSEPSREDWRRLFEIIGVNTRPRILSSPRRFPAPLDATWGPLNIREPANCPIEAADSFWRQYLETWRHRDTNVHTGQSYTFDRVTWIDGLDQRHASAVLEMILRDPYHYESGLNSSLGREVNLAADSNTVPSLWVHSFRQQDWPVIPASDGLHRPSECWIVRGAQGATRQRRYDLLHSVEPRWLDASRILVALGVEDLDDASVNAILRELERLALRANLEADGLGRAGASLAEDLYGRLQRVVGDEPSQPSPHSLGTIKFLPLLRNGRIVGLPLAEIVEAYYQDDIGRAAFVPAMDTGLRWPFSPRLGTGGITRWFRGHLGEPAVLLTSEAEVETGFVSRGRSMPFLDWIKSNFAGHQQVITDLGCLIAYAGSKEIDPGNRQFREHWAKFSRATLAIGQFTLRPDTPVFINTREHGQVEIQASERLSSIEILGETWRLVTNALEDAWRLYCFELAKGEFAAAQFLHVKKEITERDREDVETAIGFTSIERLQRIKAAVYAFRRAKLGESIEDFNIGWDDNANQLNQVVEWLGPPFTRAFLTELLTEPREDDAFPKLLQASNVSISEWQECRSLFGQPRHRFSSTLQLWTETRSQICAMLKASLARLPGTDLDSTRTMIERFASVEAPASVTETPATFRVIRDSLIDAALELKIGGGSRSTDVVRHRLESLRQLSATEPVQLRLAKEPPERDVREFRDVAQDVRSRQARERFDLYQAVAVALARTLGETLDDTSLSTAGNLPSLLNGYWANRYSMAPILQGELRKLAPKTLAVMMERDAFKSDFTPSELRSLFPEIQAQDAIGVAGLPRKLTLVGLEIDETDLEHELSRGSNGSIGAALIAAAGVAPAWDASWLSGERETLAAQARREGAGGRRGERRQPRESDSERQLNGMLGEMFLFERLKALGIPDFDGQCWISTNRCHYTGYPDGDDSAGYDFTIDDADGRLTNRGDRPVCLIEVKSSSGDAEGPFKISENEWRRATEAHFSAREEYLIVRIAHVRSSAPQIVDILRDPYALMTQSKLKFVGGDLTAQVGART